MKRYRPLALAFSLIPLVVGIWLLSHPGRLMPESSVRQQALRQLSSPALVNGARETGEAHTYEPIAPVVVDLRDVPANVYDPNNQYDQWLRGNIDLDEPEGILSEVELRALRQAAQRLPPSSALRTSSPANSSTSPTTLGGFDALDVTGCCGGGSSVPPDSHLAAGTQHLVAAVNLAFAVYDKGGTLLAGPTTFASFFAAISECVAGPNGAFDPTVLYDEEAGRFILTVDGNGTHICIAVTTSPDPTATWNLYHIPADVNGAFHDYPHTGVGQDAIFVGGNQFNGSIFIEGRVWVADKEAMYNGEKITPRTFSTGVSSTPQPLNLHGYLQGAWPGHNTHYFITDLYNGCSLQVWRWEDALNSGVPLLVATFDLCEATGVNAGIPFPAPQLDGGELDTNDFRFRGLEYHKGRAWTADTISCNPGQGSVNCLRWTEIDLTTITPTLVQSAVFASDNEHRMFPDLAVNRCGDMAVGYNKASSNTYAGVWVNGRQSGDPNATLGAELLMKEGEVTYAAFDGSPYRWGDYSSMAIDPNGMTFWHIGEYSKSFENETSANWGNYVGAFHFESCSLFSLGTNSAISAPPASSIVHEFVLTNYLSDTQTFTLTVNGNDWPTTLLTTSPLTVEQGMTQTVSVQVDMPYVVGTSDTFLLTATSASDPLFSRTVQGTTTPSGAAGVVTASDVSSKTGRTGTVLSYTLTVTNTGDYTDTFDILLSASNWTANKQTAQTAALVPGASETTEVTVVVGDGSDVDTVTVTFSSGMDSAVSDSVTLTSIRRSFIYLPQVVKPGVPSPGVP